MHASKIVYVTSVIYIHERLNPMTMNGNWVIHHSVKVSTAPCLAGGLTLGRLIDASLYLLSVLLKGEQDTNYFTTLIGCCKWDDLKKMIWHGNICMREAIPVPAMKGLETREAQQSESCDCARCCGCYTYIRALACLCMPKLFCFSVQSTQISLFRLELKLDFCRF